MLHRLDQFDLAFRRPHPKTRIIRNWLNLSIPRFERMLRTEVLSDILTEFPVFLLLRLNLNLSLSLSDTAGVDLGSCDTFSIN